MSLIISLNYNYTKKAGVTAITETKSFTGTLRYTILQNLQYYIIKADCTTSRKEFVVSDLIELSTINIMALWQMSYQCNRSLQCHKNGKHAVKPHATVSYISRLFMKIWQRLYGCKCCTRAAQKTYTPVDIILGLQVYPLNTNKDTNENVHYRESSLPKLTKYWFRIQQRILG